MRGHHHPVDLALAVSRHFKGAVSTPQTSGRGHLKPRHSEQGIGGSSATELSNLGELLYPTAPSSRSRTFLAPATR
jgi:hypothetical protein